MTSLSHLENPPEKPPQLDDFCRICLLRKVQLRPLATQFSGVMIAEMLYKVTGTLLNMQDLLPRVICDRCLVKLDLAYAISEEFRKQDEKLRRFWWKGGVLVDELMAYARTEESWRKTHSEEVLDRLASGRLDPVPVAFEVQKEVQSQAGASAGETVEKTALPVKEQIKSEVDEYCIEILSDDSAGEANEESTLPNIIDNEVEMALGRVLPADSQEELLVEQELPNQQQPEEEDAFAEEDAPSSPAESESNQDDDNDKDSDYVPEGIDDIASELGQIEAEDPFRYQPRLKAHEQIHKLRNDPVAAPSQTDSSGQQQDGKGFAFASCLRLHETTQHAQCGTKRKRAPINRKGKHFQCELCPINIWRSKADFLRHVKKHGEHKKAEGRYNCHKCCRTYEEKDRLEKHLKRHEVEESGIYRCRNCGKSFAENYVLKRHVSKCVSKKDPPPIKIVREGKSYFKCRECAKVYVSRYRHNRHAKTHAGMPKSESHQCPDCGKRFGQRANLRLHQQEVHHSFVVKAEPGDEGGQGYEAHLQGQQRDEAAEVTAGGSPAEELTTPASDQPSDLPIIKEVTSSYVKYEEAPIEQSPVVLENLSMDESKREITDSIDPDQPEPGLAFVQVDNVPPLVNIPEWQDQASAAGSDYANSQLTDEQDSLEATGFSIEILSDNSDDDDDVVELSEDDELEAGSRPSTSCSESATSVDAALTKSWTCNLCSIVMSGPTKASITKHMIMHQNILNGKYECEVCHKKFGFDPELQQHRRLIHNMKQPTPKDVVECEKCGKEITRNKFTFHLKYHKNLDARYFVCEVCDKAFGMMRQLQWHKQSKTCQKARQKQEQQKQKRPPSTTLPVLIQNRNTLQTPEQRHQEGRYKCTECNKSYANSQTIQMHMEQHQAIREGRFKCGICELACPTAWHLETHVRIHPESTQQGDNLATK